MLQADIFIATGGDLIASIENDPFNKVSKNHFCLSSTVIVLCSIAKLQIRGHNSITFVVSTLSPSPLFEAKAITRQTSEIVLITSSNSLA